MLQRESTTGIETMIDYSYAANYRFGMPCSPPRRISLQASSAVCRHQVFRKFNESKLLATTHDPRLRFITGNKLKGVVAEFCCTARKVGSRRNDWMGAAYCWLGTSSQTLMIFSSSLSIVATGTHASY